MHARLHTCTHTHTHAHAHAPVTPVLTVEQSAVVNNTITLTCTAIAFPSPIAVLWQSISDVMTLNSIEIFTVTDIDFTVTTTTDVDLSVCEPDGYRCVAHNRRGMIRQSVTLCSGGCGSNAHICPIGLLNIT